MADEQIRIDVTAEDDASKVLEDVAKDAEKLEKLEPEVKVGADTGAAKRGLQDVIDDAERLGRSDQEIVLKARIDDAKGQLKALRDDLDQTGDQARRTATELDKVGGDPGGGLQTRGNAIADLTGPLGDASGAASDFAGVFDGLGDIAADTAGKLGASQATIGRVSGAMGALGIAVAAGAAAWTLFRQNQEKAAERQRELVEGQRAINDAIREGNAVAAGSKFNELYGADVTAGAKVLGVSIQEVTQYVLGQSDAIAKDIAALEQQGGTAELVAKVLMGLRDTYAETNGTIAEQDAVVRAVTEAFKGSTRETDLNTKASERADRQARITADGLDKIRDALDIQDAALDFRQKLDYSLADTRTNADRTSEEILQIKRDILDVAAAAGLTPIEVKSYLERIDQGDVDGVMLDVNHKLANRSAEVQTSLRPPTQAEYAQMAETIRRGVGTVYLTAVLNSVRSGAYGGS